jgi:hypothetical protein
MLHQIIHFIGGIDAFAMISIFLFMTVFSGALLWACCQNKSAMHSMGTMPLRDGEGPADEKGEPHHD